MVKDDAYFNSITEQIIGCAFKVSNTLGPGFLEKVYENALCHELKKSELNIGQQCPVNVFYDDNIIGEFYTDLVVEGDVLVELKAVKGLDTSHFSQCMNYLKATGKRICLLLNFGAEKVEIRRIVNSESLLLNADTGG